MAESKKSFIVTDEKNATTHVSIRKPNGEMVYLEGRSVFVCVTEPTDRVSDGHPIFDSRLEYIFAAPKDAAHMFQLILDFLFDTAPNLARFQLHDFLKRKNMIVDTPQGEAVHIKVKKEDAEKEMRE